MDTTTAAAIVISKARRFYAESSAAFDYKIAVEGIGGPMGELGNMTYELANEGATDRNTDERERAWMQLWEQILPELEAYGEKCRTRKYTGWSNASRGPIRYAH